MNDLQNTLSVYDAIDQLPRDTLQEIFHEFGGFDRPDIDELVDAYHERGEIERSLLDKLQVALRKYYGTVLWIRHVAKTYSEGGLHTEVLRDADFKVNPGETLAIVGASGSGKSTLLHIVGGLDTASGGDVTIHGQRLSSMSDAERGRVRNQSLGFIYQFHHLLPEFTALENVCMPLMIRGTPLDETRERAAELLDRVGLSHRIGHKPSEMSGGERQRCAVARALVTRPACILGDEPTGNLDEKNAAQVYELMLELNSEIDTSFVLVTHSPSLAARMDRVLELTEGHLVDPGG